MAASRAGWKAVFAVLFHMLNCGHLHLDWSLDMVIVDFHIREIKEIAEEQVALGGQRKVTAVSLKIILGSGEHHYSC